MPPPRKPRLLIIAYSLAQGGSERFFYEFCKAVDRERFDITILTRSRRRAPDYYEPKLRDLGIRIIHGFPSFLQFARRVTGRGFAFPPVRAVANAVHRLLFRYRFGDLLAQHDVIYVNQIDNYHLVEPLLRDNDKVITHLMSHAVQYAVNPYSWCSAGRKYRFVLFDPPQVDDLAGTRCAGAETIQIPLSLDPSPFPDLSDRVSSSPPFRIAIFQRLNPREHPFAGFFEAFRIVAGQLDAELVIYGHGDPAVFAADLKRHGIEGRVRFMGHTSSIEHALREERISIVWQISIGGAIGYSSIEIATYGFPLLLWNIIESRSEDVASASGGALRAFHDPELLAQETLRLLSDREALLGTGRELRTYAMRQHDIRRHIERLENKLEEIARPQP